MKQFNLEETLMWKLKKPDETLDQRSFYKDEDMR